MTFGVFAGRSESQFWNVPNYYYTHVRGESILLEDCADQLPLVVQDLTEENVKVRLHFKTRNLLEFTKRTRISDKKIQTYFKVCQLKDSTCLKTFRPKK